MTDELDERVEHMARAIYEAYGALIEAPESYRWDDALAAPDTYKGSLAKFRAIADDALDKIEWIKFGLAPKEAGGG